MGTIIFLFIVLCGAGAFAVWLIRQRIQPSSAFTPQTPTAPAPQQIGQAPAPQNIAPAAPTITPLEKHRARIEAFEEDRETLAEKAVRSLFLGLAYVLPFLVSLSVGKEIGDAYADTANYFADGWSIGTHTVAYAGELALAMMVLSTATAIRRYKADASYTPKLLSSIFFFLVFIVASGLAQWFIAEQHIHPKNTADLAALIFRVAMPPAVDIASMLYLSIMGYKSLKKFLAEQQQKAEAIRLLNEAELTIQAAQQEAERRHKEAESALAMKERREALLLRIEEIHSQAMIDTAQRALLPGAAHGLERLQARMEQWESMQRVTPVAPLVLPQSVSLEQLNGTGGASNGKHSF